MTTEQVEKPDRKDLKVQALLNRVTSTENENADLRVQIHLLNEEVQRIFAEQAEQAEPVQEEVKEVNAPKKKA